MLPVSDFKIEKKQSFNLIGKIRVKLLIFLGFAVLTLFFTQLVFANNLATDGQRLSQIEDQINQLQAENSILKVKIAQESSLTNLSQKAKDQGFLKPTKVITP